MIMMQTGMVKQGLNSATHTYIDGMNKRIRKQLLLASFAKKTIKTYQILHMNVLHTYYCYYTLLPINDNQRCSATYIALVQFYYYLTILIFSFVHIDFRITISIIWKYIGITCMLYLMYCHVHTNNNDNNDLMINNNNLILNWIFHSLTANGASNAPHGKQSTLVEFPVLYAIVYVNCESRIELTKPDCRKHDSLQSCANCALWLEHSTKVEWLCHKSVMHVC